jgi:replicative DNA helicase
MGSFDKFKVHTGYDEIDHLISGLHSGDLTAIVGGVGTGKTTFLANIAMNIAMKARQEVAFMSLQHMPDQLGLRFLGVQSNVVMRDVIRGYIRLAEWHELTCAATYLVEAPLIISDIPINSIVHLIDEVRKIKQVKKQLKLLIIDSFGMLQVHDKKEYAEGMRLLKQAALELRLPILISCTVKTKVLKKDNKTVIRDVRFDSIETYADSVMMINLKTSDFVVHVVTGNSTIKNNDAATQTLITRIKTEITLLKNTYGPLGSVFLNFIPQQWIFESIEGTSEQD